MSADIPGRNQGLHGKADELTPFINSLGMKMMPVPCGAFCAGSLMNGANKNYYEFVDEAPVLIQIKEPFYIAEYPVTNAQYKNFVLETGYEKTKGLKANGNGTDFNFKPWEDEHWNSDNQPVVCVTFSDMLKFCEWLSQKEKKNLYVA